MKTRFYKHHSEIPKTLVEYFEGISNMNIVDIDLFHINDFIAMMETDLEENIEETVKEEA